VGFKNVFFEPLEGPGEGKKGVKEIREREREVNREILYILL